MKRTNFFVLLLQIQSVIVLTEGSEEKAIETQKSSSEFEILL